MYKFVTGFALTVIILSSCKDELSKTGLGLLDKGDLVTIRKETIGKENIKAYTVTDKKQRTDEPAYNLLGSFNDPVFGKSITDFAVQLRILSYPKFKKNALIDSLVYFVGYKEFYGDTITPQKLKIYELASDLNSGIGDINYKYYQDEDLKALAKPEILAEMDYIPRYRDSLRSTTSTVRDTIEQVMAFHLNHSLARKLMALDSASLSDNDLFIKKFKGLYVEAGDLNQGGTIMKIKGSVLALYYRQENDTFPNKLDKVVHYFYVTDNAARVNRFTHDYSTARFANSLDKPDQTDSLIYLQTTGGLAGKIFIPRLGSLKTLFPSLGSDTTNLAINKAELVFQVDTILTDTTALKVLSPPSKVILSAIAENDSLYFLSDLGFSQAYFGGFYNSKDKTYRFNIAKHLQEMINADTGKRRKNYGFYLSTDTRNAIFRRVILKGTTSKTGIRLDITYSKIN